jgi:hypothetical protein
MLEHRSVYRTRAPGRLLRIEPVSVPQLQPTGQRSAAGSQGVDLAGNCGVFDQRWGVMGFDSCVDDQWA